MADAQAEVSAETAGRVVETPVERGTRVPQGALLVRISPAETAAQLQEADANAAQIEAKLGFVAGQPFDRMRVPDVMNAKSSLDLAEAEFNRMRSLVDQKVISQSEFDQRRTQLEAARQNYQASLNLADQSYRSLEAARARVALARKAVADTVRPRTVDRARRRTGRERWRLRHPWPARRHGRADRSPARRAHDPRAARVARQGRAAGAAHRRRVSRARNSRPPCDSSLPRFVRTSARSQSRRSRRTPTAA